MKRPKPDIVPPPPPPRMVGVGSPYDALAWSAIVGFLAVVVLASFIACVKHAASTPAEASRATARAALLTLAEATKAADATCASLARDKASAELAGRCATSYDKSRATLVAVATVVDRWDAAADSRQTVICSAHDVADELARMVDTMRGADASASSPPIVVDALALVSLIGTCTMGDAGR